MPKKSAKSSTSSDSSDDSDDTIEEKICSLNKNYFKFKRPYYGILRLVVIVSKLFKIENANMHSKANNLYIDKNIRFAKLLAGLA